MADVPQFALPFTGAEIEQGSPREVVQRVAVLCRTPPGWWDGHPDLGLYEQAHLAGGADVGEIGRQIAAYVPDAEVAVDEDLSALNDALSVLNVQVAQP